jgi:hypothetical protein
MEDLHSADMQEIRSEDLVDYGQTAGISVCRKDLDEFAAASDSPMINFVCPPACPD